MLETHRLLLGSALSCNRRALLIVRNMKWSTMCYYESNGIYGFAGDCVGLQDLETVRACQAELEDFPSMAELDSACYI